MASDAFQSAPFPTEEAAVAAVTSVAVQSAPPGMRARITGVITQKVNDLWIAVATVDLIEIDVEMTETAVSETDGKSEGDDEGEGKARSIVDIYYLTPAPGELPDPQIDLDIAELSAPQDVDYDGGSFYDQASDVPTGPETLADNADLLAEQLITDFNDIPAPVYVAAADSIAAENRVEEQTREERREEALRREMALNAPVPPDDLVKPAPLT